MSLRERLLTTLRGSVSDRIPWTIYSWLLPHTPAGFRMHSRGLALMGSARLYRDTLDQVEISESRRTVNGRTKVRTCYETPVGTLTQESATESGYGTHYRQKYLLTNPEDYAVAQFILEHTQCEPDFSGWLQQDDLMGDGGIVVGEILPVPILQLMVDWMGAQGLAEGIYLYRDRFDALIAAYERIYHRQVEIAAASPAEIIWFPDNVTGSIISPKLFGRYCAPVYARAMPLMRQSAKIPVAHYDGDNRTLISSLAGTDLPVMEAFTPPPMGDLAVAEAKRVWPDKTIWVNFPGNYFLESSEAITAYTFDLLSTSAPGGRLLIGCTEDFPIPQFEKTFDAIGRALAAYQGDAW
jgi:hypothetical protein